MVMSDNSMVNLDNLALCIMEAGIRKGLSYGRIDEGKGRQYVLAVETIALQIKNNQALTRVQQGSILKLIYHDRPNKSTMGSMRKILSEIGSTLEYKHHEVLPNEKL